MFAVPIPTPPNASVFNGCGLTTSRPTKPIPKRAVASAMVPHVVAKPVLWTTHTPLAWNRPACVSSSPLVLWRTSASTAPTSVTHSQKLLHPRRHSTCVSTTFFSIGGLHTLDVPPYIPYGHVLPVRRALQGHPESPRLWERHVTAILEDLSFVPTTHEPRIYRGTVDGHSVLFLRQIGLFPSPSLTPPPTRNFATLSIPASTNPSNGWAYSVCTIE